MTNLVSGSDRPENPTINKLLEENMKTNTQIRDLDRQIKQCFKKIEAIEKTENADKTEEFN